MKKIIIVITSLTAIAIAGVVAFFSIHFYKDAYDSESHYLQCGLCNKKKNIEPHDIDVKSGKFSCMVCGFEAFKGLSLIDSTELANKVFDANFDKNHVVPGNYSVYMDLWSNDRDSSLHTYEVEYSDLTDYYFFYMKKEIINDLTNRFDTDGKSDFYSPKNEYLKIDGKYLYMYKNLEKMNPSDICIFKGSDISDAKVIDGSYQLVLTAQSKSLKLISELCHDRTLNKTITILNKVNVLYDDDNTFNKRLDSYSNTMSDNNNLVENRFCFKGKAIEAFSPIIESTSFSFYLYNSDTSNTQRPRCVLHEENGVKSVEVVRYYDDNHTKDYLKEDASPIPWANPFKELKTEFTNALIKDVNGTNNALFYYSDIVNIIRANKA